ncbi:hypothetical protein [Streptomyces sp. NPDC091371]|uniref:hypothetical protein n=1 Tax=Streptomyces sp. NPDC091371 TaxID=3155303 RepID=UPI00343D4A87
MTASRSIGSWQRVESRQDFITHLRLLSAACATACNGRDPRAPAAQRWTNQSVDGFLGSVTGPDEVDGADSLRMYVATLAVDFARDQRETRVKADRGEWAFDGGSWAHGDLHAVLESWAAWLAADTPYHAKLEPVTWRSVADQLSAAQIYE